MKRLWTGKTARQELKDNATSLALVNGGTAWQGIESCLSGADKAPDTSINRESLRYWEGLAWTSQWRLVGEIRTALRNEDRLIGRKIKR